eukprot:1146484-Pelagomonas_calceolata.AAC.4
MLNSRKLDWKDKITNHASKLLDHTNTSTFDGQYTAVYVRTCLQGQLNRNKKVPVTNKTNLIFKIGGDPQPGHLNDQLVAGLSQPKMNP